MSASDTPSRRLTGRHVLAVLLGFFGVMLGVNGAMVYLALATFGGIDTPDAYRKGLAYNATIAEESVQGSLGWTTRLRYDEPLDVLRLEVSDGAGRGVSGLRIAGRLMRPATSRLDRAIGELVDRGRGHYELSLDGVEAGAWIVAFEAQGSRPDGATFRMKERLWLGPGS
jgi:nitrogen fixation protein FixH